tara:strand:+ start:1309 stop:1479 length:171 start_codon:yes stop_codon:yes gene_type:complete
LENLNVVEQAGEVLIDTLYHGSVTLYSSTVENTENSQLLVSSYLRDIIDPNPFLNL